MAYEPNSFPGNKTSIYHRCIYQFFFFGGAILGIEFTRALPRLGKHCTNGLQPQPIPMYFYTEKKSSQFIVCLP